MNYFDLGYYDNKLLHLIGGKYINGTIALFLLNNNVEYAEITMYNKKLKLSDGYLLLNSNMNDKLKKFLIKKNIFKIVKTINEFEIAMINKNVYDKIFYLLESIKQKNNSI